MNFIHMGTKCHSSTCFSSEISLLEKFPPSKFSLARRRRRLHGVSSEKMRIVADRMGQ